MNTIDIKFIPKNTKEVFEKISLSDFIEDFVLVGGTALSLQIHHRLSEDLDFLYSGNKLKNNIIIKNIHNLFQDYRIIRENGFSQIDFIINQTKVTFFSADAIAVYFPVKDYSFKYKRMNIATIECISCLKFSAISQRNTMRDYYDLYCIANQYMDLAKMIEASKKLLPHLSPITYTETLIYTDDLIENTISNHLEPKNKISKKNIADFFIKELRKILLTNKAD